MSQPDFQPTLVGPSITVRPISKDDWIDMFAAGTDPEIWKVHPVPDRYTEAGFRKFFDGAVDSKMGFAFVDQSNGRIIGSSRLPSVTGGSARWCNSVTLVAALQRQPRNDGRGSRRGCAAR